MTTLAPPVESSDEAFTTASSLTEPAKASARQLLVRYGAVPEVVRCAVLLAVSGTELSVPARGDELLIETPRGLFPATVLEQLAPRHAREAEGEDALSFTMVRPLTPADRITLTELTRSAREEFRRWSDRIRDWKLDLELLDSEWSFDRSRLVLFVLGGRGAETTRLALNAVGIGIEYLEVQPVDGNGPVPVQAAGGSCGTGGGCGCG